MILASSGIILEDRRILLVLRGNYTRTFNNYWACPGGRGEERETPEEIVTREIKEELNLDFTPTRLFSTGEYKNRNLFRFLGEWEGDIRLNNYELDGHGWFSYKQTLDLPLAFDYREVLEELHKENLL